MRRDACGCRAGRLERLHGTQPAPLGIPPHPVRPDWPAGRVELPEHFPAPIHNEEWEKLTFAALVEPLHQLCASGDSLCAATAWSSFEH